MIFREQGIIFAATISHFLDFEPVYICFEFICFFRINFWYRIWNCYFSKKCFMTKYFYFQSLNFGNEKELSFKFYRKYSTLHYHFKSREYVIKVCDCYSGNILRLLRSNSGFTARLFAIILKYSKMSQNQCLSGKYFMILGSSLFEVNLLSMKNCFNNLWYLLLMRVSVRPHFYETEQKHSTPL